MKKSERLVLPDGPCGGARAAEKIFQFKEVRQRQKTNSLAIFKLISTRSFFHCYLLPFVRKFPDIKS